MFRHLAGVAVLTLASAIAVQTVQGRRRNDRQERAGAADVWLIGSTGKVMTAAMIARLAERGVLDWKAPLEKMLPDLAAGMLPAYRQVTLLQLLSHRAGLSRELLDLKGAEHFFGDTRPTGQQRLAYIAQALKDRPEVTPGTAFAYSNTGFLIAAAIAEQAGHCGAVPGTGHGRAGGGQRRRRHGRRQGLERRVRQAVSDAQPCKEDALTGLAPGAMAPRLFLA